jgi:hypothetical protein
MIGPVSRVPRAPSASIRVHLLFIPLLAPDGGLPPISEALQIPVIPQLWVGIFLSFYFFS